MKNLFVLFLLAMLGGNTWSQETKERFTTESPLIETTKKLIEAYENQDWDTWKSKYSADTKMYHNNWDNPGTTQSFIEGQKEVLSTLSSYEFLDEPVYYEQIIDDEGKTWVYFWGMWQGTLKGNNSTVRIPVHLALQFQNDKIAEEYGFYDLTPYYEAYEASSNPDNLSVIKQVYKDFSVGNIEGVTSAMDEEIVWNEAENFPYADGNPYKGSDAIVQGVFARLGGEWDNWSLNDLDFQPVASDRVVVTGRYSATYKKNGKPLNSQMLHLWTLKNGKITGFQQYTDTKQIAEVMQD
ncbi:nuclear transport factor 2 family protein [Gramella sp. KN1008]|uniref:nuclear transport factor 2 family protein n=1 Tax=Gramella sp. KN1008 TaxID=2529298 RepID=UPI00103FB2F6|nr:nuclear transport factor 2 family protein [Gramella sp. KN1008]TBW30227.1 hypothetical protein EZJ28_02145 [Gramella sp. KN1008]